MVLEGKVITLIPTVRNGQGKNGQWACKYFVIETNEEHPKTVKLDVYGNEKDHAALDEYKKLKVGDPVRLGIEVKSREWQGKWYTDVNVEAFFDVDEKTFASASSPTKAAPAAPAATKTDDNSTELPF